MSARQPQILYVVHQYGRLAGVELHVHRLSDGLQDRYRVAIVSADEGQIRLFADGRQTAAFPVRPLSFPGPLRSPPHEEALARILASMQPDLIHIQHLLNWPMSALQILIDSGIPTVLSTHDYFAITPLYTMQGVDQPEQTFTSEFSRKTFGSDITPYLYARRDLIARCLPQLQARVAVSPYLQRTLARVFRDPFQVIEYGIKPFRPVVLPKPATGLRFGFFGNLIPSKGWQGLLDAFRLVRRDYPAAELHMHGWYAVEPPSQEGVRYLGAYQPEDLPRLCAGIDVAVIPSVFAETYCLVLSEMWMAGLPVAVSDIGAMGERVSDGVNGKKFAPGNVPAMADALRWFLEHDDWRRWQLPQPRQLQSMVDEYDRLYREILARRSAAPAPAAMTAVDPEMLRAEAYRTYQAGDAATAERLCRQLLHLQPRHAEATYLLGVIAQDAGKQEQACEFFRQAVLIAPDNAVFANALGELYFLMGRRAEAMDCFRKALAARPTYDRAHNSLGRLLHAEGDLPGAKASFAEAVRVNPQYSTAHNNLGAVLQAQAQLDAAAAHFRQALSLRPDYPEAQFNLGTTLQALGDSVAAAARFREAVRLRPGYIRAHFHLGQVLEQQRHERDALECYQTAARLQPGDGEIQRRLGDLLMLKGDWPAALAALERAATLQPDQDEPFARLIYGKQLVCDWRTYDADQERLWADAEKKIAAGESAAVVPFQALTLPWPRARLLAVARSHCQAIVRHQRERGQTLKLQFPRSRTGRLRVGYLSGDFYDHPISHLIQGLFGRHDRDRVEVFAYSFSPPDNSVYRQRVAKECEHFVEIAPLSIPALAQRIAADGIHVLVDLMGHTGVNRLSALALRPAPIQVSFLGMLGTMGADFIDYLITDRIVTPPEFAPEFTERFATLPHSYLIAEPEPALPEDNVSRAAHGLPEDGFVFCSFSSTYKIEPRTFAVWMRILQQTPGSVLWMYSTGSVFENNLRREAAAAGVAPERIVFGPFVPRPQHIFRHRAADLFLDTLQYNAAATASLALQAGLPVLTCQGDTFASRVGASLLHTLGLPELIAPNVERYEQKAIELARRPNELRRLRDRLAAERVKSPLFDTQRFVRNLERAYLAMWDIHAAGRPPEALEVIEPIPPG